MSRGEEPPAGEAKVEGPHAEARRRDAGGAGRGHGQGVRSGAAGFGGAGHGATSRERHHQRGGGAGEAGLKQGATPFWSTYGGRAGGQGFRRRSTRIPSRRWPGWSASAALPPSAHPAAPLERRTRTRAASSRRWRSSPCRRGTPRCTTCAPRGAASSRASSTSCGAAHRRRGEAVPTGKLGEAVSPRGTELRLTPAEGVAGVLPSPTGACACCPSSLESTEVRPRWRGPPAHPHLRVAPRAQRRPRARSSLHARHLDEYLPSLAVFHALRKHMRR